MITVDVVLLIRGKLLPEAKGSCLKMNLPFLGALKI